VPFDHPFAEFDFTQLPSKYILCGEDDKDDEDLLQEIFSTMDPSFTLYFAHNGRKLVSALAKLPEDRLPCLIILDYNMPELNAAEILTEVNKHDRYNAIPKIIWSTSGADKYKKLCLNLGATDYVIKPSNVNDLRKIVQYMISYC